MKIYSDDPLVHYKNSALTPERTRAEIDALLGYWKVSDIHWHWKPEENDVYVRFILEETVDGLPVRLTVKTACPIIWDKERPRARPPQMEQVNWRISMRALWWFLKTHLEMSYAMQSSKVAAFLPYLVNSQEQLLKDILVPQIAKSGQFESLPTPEESKMYRRVIDVPAKENP